MKIRTNAKLVFNEATANKATLLLIFLAGVNLFNKYFYLCFAAVFIFVCFKKKLIIDVDFLFLLLLAIAWLLFSPDSDSLSLTFILKPVVYPLMYLIGRNVLLEKDSIIDLSDAEKKIKTMSCIAAGGLYCHYLLNYLSSAQTDSRNTIDFWTGTPLSATCQAAMACLMVAVAIAVLYTTPRMSQRIGALIVILSIFMYNLVLSGRTLIFIAVFVALGCLAFLWLTDSGRRTKLRPVAVILCLAVGIYIVLSRNMFGVQEKLLSSNLVQRFLNASNEKIFTSGRGDSKIFYVENFRSSLWGGQKIRQLCGSYAHDLYLDTYDEAGIVALLAVAIFVVRSSLCAFRFIRDTRVEIITRAIILAVFLASLLEFMVEPILQGTPWLFAMFCFICGLIKSFENMDLIDGSEAGRQG